MFKQLCRCAVSVVFPLPILFQHQSNRHASEAGVIVEQYPGLYPGTNEVGWRELVGIACQNMSKYV